MAKASDLAVAGFKHIGTSYEMMDCQKFVEQCLSDIGIKKDLPGSNSWYRFLMKNGWTGTVEECKRIYGSVPKGAFLFIHSAVSEKTPAKFRDDGIGDLTHIGIKTGQGKGAIHSSKTNGSVCESSFNDKSINGGWNRVGLWNIIDYTEKVNSILNSYGEGADDDGMLSDDTDAQSSGNQNGNEVSGTIYAIVKADSGSTVNMRKKTSKTAPLVERVPIGAEVKILKDLGGWHKISYTDKRGVLWVGYMMSEFLEFEEPVDEGEIPEGFSILISGLTEEEVNELRAKYPTAVITVG